MPYGNLAVDTVTTSTGQVLGAGNATGFKNRIINGAMTIDQRNAGASVTPAASANTYTVDRWFIVTSANTGSKVNVAQNLNAISAPVGFTNYFGSANISAYSPASGDQLGLRQTIEGYNISDLNWGTANAQAVTLSFWVRSSLTGTFSGSIYNNGATRAYVFSFTVSSVNTFEYKTITIPGDTTGTWNTANSVGLTIQFNLGNGSTYLASSTGWGSTYYAGLTGSQSPGASSGATFYITGVQLEVGSTATSFDVRDIGREVALCQRYFEKGSCWYQCAGSASSAGVFNQFSVTKRAATTNIFSNTAFTGGITALADFTSNLPSPTGTTGFAFYVAPAVTGGYTTFSWSSSAEL
jgi:hypothetical protein